MARAYGVLDYMLAMRVGSFRNTFVSNLLVSLINKSPEGKKETISFVYPCRASLLLIFTYHEQLDYTNTPSPCVMNDGSNV